MSQNRPLLPPCRVTVQRRGPKACGKHRDSPTCSIAPAGRAVRGTAPAGTRCSVSGSPHCPADRFVAFSCSGYSSLSLALMVPIALESSLSVSLGFHPHPAAQTPPSLTLPTPTLPRWSHSPVTFTIRVPEAPDRSLICPSSSLTPA